MMRSLFQFAFLLIMMRIVLMLLVGNELCKEYRASHSGGSYAMNAGGSSWIDRISDFDPFEVLEGSCVVQQFRSLRNVVAEIEYALTRR